jgi:mRNA interferase RelE/StbE
MEFLFSNRFKKEYKSLSNETKKLPKKKLALMAENPMHPSLRTKKIQGRENVYECSISMAIRMTWEYKDEKIFLRSIGEHDSTLKNP